MPSDSVRSVALGRGLRHHCFFIEKLTCTCVCIDISIYLYRYNIERMWTKGELWKRNGHRTEVLCQKLMNLELNSISELKTGSIGNLILDCPPQLAWASKY